MSNRSVPRLVPCGQCSEQFSIYKPFCPRCGKWSGRGPLPFALKFFTFLITAAAICWTVWIILKAENVPVIESAVKSLPAAATAPSGQPDVRF